MSLHSGKRRRDVFGVSADIIRACKDPCRKTKVMFEAEMNFDQLGRYLPMLVEAGLLSYCEATRSYQSTVKGREYLEKHAAMTEAAAHVQKLDEELRSHIVSAPSG